MDLYDINCFVGRWPTESLGCVTVPDLQQEMNRLDIGQALVRHSWSWWYDPTEGNSLLLDSLAGKANLRPCLAATPLVEDELGGLESFLNQLAQSNAGAVCLYPNAQHFSLEPWSAGNLLDALQSLAMPVILEMEEVDWGKIRTVAAQWTELPLIITRVGYRILRYLLPLMRSYDNVHVDIAYLADNEAVEYLVKAIGAERILFGTGTPRVDGAGALSRLAYSTVTEREKEQIGCKNALRLMSSIKFNQEASLR